MVAASHAINPDLALALKRLRLGRIAATLPERLALADKQDMPLDDVLLMLLTDEIACRDNAAADNRATDAKLDPSMRLELWDKTAKVSFDKKMLNASDVPHYDPSTCSDPIHLADRRRSPSTTFC